MNREAVALLGAGTAYSAINKDNHSQTLPDGKDKNI